jgi:dCMP deaminase
MNVTFAQSMLAMAKSAAGNSPDPDTKVGCVIVTANPGRAIIRSWNDFARDVDHISDRMERPEKYKWIEHAEREGIYLAARKGYSLEGAIMFLPFHPCADCARAIIQSGIKALYCYEPNWDDEKWGQDFCIAHTMLSEAGVVVTYEVP